MTNWEVAIFMWWDSNPNCKFPKPINPIMPDYRTMRIITDKKNEGRF